MLKCRKMWNENVRTACDFKEFGLEKATTHNWVHYENKNQNVLVWPNTFYPIILTKKFNSFYLEQPPCLKNNDDNTKKSFFVNCTDHICFVYLCTERYWMLWKRSCEKTVVKFVEKAINSFGSVFLAATAIAI